MSPRGRAFVDRPHHGRVEAQPPPSAAEDSLTSAQEQSWGPASKAQQVVAHGETQRALILTTPDKTKVRILFEPGPPLPPPNSVSRRTGFFFSEDSIHPRRATLFGGGRGEKRTLFCRGLNVSASLIAFFSSVLLSLFVSQVSAPPGERPKQASPALRMRLHCRRYSPECAP